MLFKSLSRKFRFSKTSDTSRASARLRGAVSSAVQSAFEPLETRCLLSATVALVKDINTATAGSNPQHFAQLNGQLYFDATDVAHGDELWKTDGTVAGTSLVADINPGPGPSYFNNPTVIGSTMYFTAFDPTHGNELWKTDGTTVTLVKDLNPGVADSAPSNLTNVNGTLFFTTSDSSGNYFLWKSDGTSAGTVQLKQFTPPDDFHKPAGLTAVGNILLFESWDSTNASQLWYSDGTTTAIAKVINPTGSAFPTDLGLLPQIKSLPNGTQAVFGATDGVNGFEPWVVTVGGVAPGYTFTTSMLKDLNPAGDSLPEDMIQVGSVIFFDANAGDGFGNHLYRTSGTAASTVLVDPNTDNVLPLVGATNTLYFLATNATHSNAALFKTAGTPATTVLVSDAPNNINTPLYNPATNSIYFNAADDAHGSELWTSAGSAATTGVVKDFIPGVFSSNATPASILNGQLIAIGADVTHGPELWTSDGQINSSNTSMLTSINPGTADSNIHYAAMANGTVVFTAFDPVNGTALWKSDGTAAGTTLISNLGSNTTNFGFFDNRAVTANGKTLFFPANNGTAGMELYKYDSTTNSVSLVMDINTGVDIFGLPAGSNPFGLTCVGNTCFFVADDGVHGPEMWKTDGTNASLVSDINPGGGGSGISGITAINGILYFAANDGVHGKELWQTDGTNTSLAADVNPGASGSNPDSLVTTGGKLYFNATGPGGIGIFQFNPATNAVSMISNIPATEMTVANGEIFFDGIDPTLNDQLFVYNPATNSTARLTSLAPGGVAGAFVTNLTASGNLLYFVADDGMHGSELWRSDGTAAGTFMAADINPLGGSFPENLTDVNGTLYFSADDGSDGVELWSSNGTAATTMMVNDIYPGNNGYAPYSSNPANFFNYNNTLMFTAADPAHGDELWQATPVVNPPRSTVGIFSNKGFNADKGLFVGSYDSSTTLSPTTATAGNNVLLESNGPIKADPHDTIHGNIELGRKAKINGVHVDGAITRTTMQIAPPTIPTFAPAPNPGGVPATPKFTVGQSVTWQGGTYYFKTLDIPDKVTITFTGPVTIYVDGDTHVHNSITLMPFDGKPQSLVFYQGNGSNFKADNKSVLIGQFIGPMAKFDIHDDATLLGTLAGQSIQLGKNARIFFDTQLNSSGVLQQLGLM